MRFVPSIKPDRGLGRRLPGQGLTGAGPPAKAARRAGAHLALWLAVGLGFSAIAAGAAPRDPLSSSQWIYMARKYFGHAPVVFDPRVGVIAPAAADDPQATPIAIRAHGLSGVRRVLVFADDDNQTRVLDYYPVRAAPSIAFSFKVDQATPIRAAMRTADGTWHVGGTWVDAQGGGCSVSLPDDHPRPGARTPPNITGRLWASVGHRQRLKLAIVHPMDTGLIAGQPKNFVDNLRIEDRQGRLLARIAPTVSVAADPIFTLQLDHRGPVRVVGQDNRHRRFQAQIAAPGP